MFCKNCGTEIENEVCPTCASSTTNEADALEQETAETSTAKGNTSADEALDKAKEATQKATAAAKDFAQSELVKDTVATAVAAVSKEPMQAIEIVSNSSQNIWALVLGLFTLMSGFVLMSLPVAALRDSVGRAVWRQEMQFAREMRATGRDGFTLPYGSLFMGGVVIALAVAAAIALCLFVIGNIKKKPLEIMPLLNLTAGILTLPLIASVLIVLTSFLSSWLGFIFFALALIGTLVMFQAVIAKQFGTDDSVWFTIASFAVLAIAYYFSLLFAIRLLMDQLLSMLW